MKNTVKRNRKQTAAVAAPQFPTFKTGVTRILIADRLFGDRFLGGSDFCVFRGLDEARQEVALLLSNGNSRVIDTYEIHVWRGDAWAVRVAGENPALGVAA